MKIKKIVMLLLAKGIVAAININDVLEHVFNTRFLENPCSCQNLIETHIQSFKLNMRIL